MRSAIFYWLEIQAKWDNIVEEYGLAIAFGWFIVLLLFIDALKMCI